MDKGIDRRGFLATSFGFIVHALQRSSYSRLLFSPCHCWVRISKNRARIGLSEYAVRELGDMVFVELPEPGTVYAAGEAFGTLEAVKTVANLVCPVTARIVRVNAALAESPHLLNESPMEAGWLCEIKLTSSSSLEGLMDLGAYERYVKQPNNQCQAVYPS